MRWLGQLARAANQNALRFNRQIDLRPLDTGKIDTNPDAFLAAIRIDLRFPGVGRELELRPRQLVSDVLQRAVEPAQLDAANRVHLNKPTRFSIIVTLTADPARASFERSVRNSLKPTQLDVDLIDRFCFLRRNSKITARK